LPIPGAPSPSRERELRDRDCGLADAPRRAAVRENLERLLVEDLGEVGEEIELVRKLAVAGQRLRHPAMIRRCLARSSACPTYNERENLEAMIEALGGVLDTRTDRVLVIDDGSPGRHRRDRRPARGRACVGVRPAPSSEGRDRPAYIAGFRRALAEGAELVLEMDCDFSHDPATCRG
jgi:hypothetical protein